MGAGLCTFEHSLTRLLSQAHKRAGLGHTSLEEMTTPQPANVVPKNRYLQPDAIAEMLADALAKGHQKILIQAPTGSGKTTAILSLADALASMNACAIFCVPASDMASQLHSDFLNPAHMLAKHAGKVAVFAGSDGDKIQYNTRVLVATYDRMRGLGETAREMIAQAQAQAKAPQSLIVFFDEAHLFASDSGYRRSLAEAGAGLFNLPVSLVADVTATPYDFGQYSHVFAPLPAKAFGFDIAEYGHETGPGAAALHGFLEGVQAGYKAFHVRIQNTSQASAVALAIEGRGYPVRVIFSDTDKRKSPEKMALLAGESFADADGYQVIISTSAIDAGVNFPYPFAPAQNSLTILCLTSQEELLRAPHIPAQVAARYRGATQNHVLVCFPSNTFAKGQGGADLKKEYRRACAELQRQAVADAETAQFAEILSPAVAVARQAKRRTGKTIRARAMKAGRKGAEAMVGHFFNDCKAQSEALKAFCNRLTLAEYAGAVGALGGQKIEILGGRVGDTYAGEIKVNASLVNDERLSFAKVFAESWKAEKSARIAGLGSVCYYSKSPSFKMQIARNIEGAGAWEPNALTGTERATIDTRTYSERRAEIETAYALTSLAGAGYGEETACAIVARIFSDAKGFTPAKADANKLARATKNAAFISVLASDKGGDLQGRAIEKDSALGRATLLTRYAIEELQGKVNGAIVAHLVGLKLEAQAERERAEALGNSPAERKAKERARKKAAKIEADAEVFAGAGGRAYFNRSELAKAIEEAVKERTGGHGLYTEIDAHILAGITADVVECFRAEGAEKQPWKNEAGKRPRLAPIAVTAQPLAMILRAGAEESEAQEALNAMLARNDADAQAMIDDAGAEAVTDDDTEPETEARARRVAELFSRIEADAKPAGISAQEPDAGTPLDCPF
jgi:hypothetical protein